MRHQHRFAMTRHSRHFHYRAPLLGAFAVRQGAMSGEPDSWDGGDTAMESEGVAEAAPEEPAKAKPGLSASAPSFSFSPVASTFTPGGAAAGGAAPPPPAPPPAAARAAGEDRPPGARAANAAPRSRPPRAGRDARAPAARECAANKRSARTAAGLTELSLAFPRRRGRPRGGCAGHQVDDDGEEEEGRGAATGGPGRAVRRALTPVQACSPMLSRLRQLGGPPRASAARGRARQAAAASRRGAQAASQRLFAQRSARCGAANPRARRRRALTRPRTRFA